MTTRGESPPESSPETSSQAEPPDTAEELRQKLTFVSEVASVALVSTTLDGTVREAGPGVENVFRKSPEEIIGKDIRELDVQAEQQDVEGILDRLRTEEKVRSRPARFLAASSKYRKMEIPGDQARQADESRILWAFDAERHGEGGFTDSLTGLADQDLFLGKTERVISRSLRSGVPAALLYMDVEDFSAVNEQYGHAVGDALLTEIANRLRETVRQHISVLSSQQAEEAADSMARIAGDRFAFVLERIGKKEAEQVGQMLQERFEDPFGVSGHTVPLSVNIGVAPWEPGGARSLNAEELLRAAETALNQVKGEERRLRTFRPEDEAHAGRLHRRKKLRRAIEEGELTLHYQPIVELEGRDIVGAEALVRWNHPEDGLVPQAVSVNVTAPAEGTGELETEILQLLRQEELSGEVLTLELTERVAFRHTSPFKELRKRGVRLAIDDFGTGHSALFYLRQFEADLIKIDRAFIEKLDTPDKTDVLARASLEIAGQLGMDAVAEGIETEAQLSRLQAMGCPLGQGYLFARPMPPDKLEDLVEEEDEGSP